MDWEEYRAKLAIAVMGEAENCSYFEKVLIACVGWNRYREQKKYYFNPLEKDFQGYNRLITINNVSRDAMEDSIKAVDEAYVLTQNNIKYRDIYFFNLYGEKPSTSSNIETEEVFFRKNLKHHFFKIK